MLRVELRSSGRALCAPNHLAVALAPQYFLFWLVDGLEVFLFVLYLNLGLIAKNDSEGDPEMTVRLALFRSAGMLNVHHLTQSCVFN